MERRRSTLPVGNSFPNIVIPQTHFLQQQLSFGSTESSDSNESFKTQLPLPYYLSQDHPANKDEPVASAYSQYTIQAQATGSSGSKSLNPASSPYIPTGSTPIIPSASLNVPGWGAPYMIDQSGRRPSVYQQQSQQMGGMQYQNENQYQQEPQMRLGGPVGGITSQVQSQFSNNLGPYVHFGGVGVTPNNQNQFTNTQTPFIAFATPETAYAAPAAAAQSSGMQYVPSVATQHLYNVPASNMYQNPSKAGLNFQSQNQIGAGSSFQSQPSTMNSNQMLGGSSFESATTMYSTQTAASSFNSGVQETVRPGSMHSNAFSFGDQQKSFNSFMPQERNSSYYSTGNYLSSNLRAPAFGGPVQGVRDLSPEKIISKNSTTKITRNRKNRNKFIEDTNVIPTPVSKLHASDAQFTSENRRVGTITPQLRSRRGETIASASGTARKQSVSAWAAEVQNSTDPGAVSIHELKMRGSPVKSKSNAMNKLTIKELDPFKSSNVAVSSHPFDCVLTGPFTGNFALGGPFSDQLMAITSGGRRNPPLVEAVDPHNVPFIEYSRFAKPDNWGVIKIKNIPYGVTRAEVLAFLGRNARIINESELEPIHIIMERVTSKTLDCFVEFLNLGEAVSAVNRFEINRMGGRGGRLGQRHVEVELSTQGALLKELFPKAKNVHWESTRPQIIERDASDPYNSGFQGFISKEELIMMVKHVETPQRDCPQRPFECLISTLAKYPWYMVEHITIEDRNMLHETTKTLLRLLIERIGHQNDGNINVNKQLLKRVWCAALRCQGFTPAMKDDIVYIANVDDRIAIEHGLAPHASYWKKLWTIGPKPNVPIDYILWYIGKIRQACVVRNRLSLAEQAEKGEEPKELKLFGDLDKHINYGAGLEQMSLAKVAKIEWAAIETALRRAFTLALPPN